MRGSARAGLKLGRWGWEDMGQNEGIGKRGGWFAERGRVLRIRAGLKKEGGSETRPYMNCP